MNNTIGIVIVTYNRIEKLKKALASYYKQKEFIKFILVVDNYSTDGTREFLENWEKKSHDFQVKAILLHENLGGSGGFYYGIKRAMNMKANWIWVSDDDAYIQDECFKHLFDYLQKVKNKNIVALCTSVITDKGIDTWHRRLNRRILFINWEQRIPLNCYKNDYFNLTYFSYVGTMINYDALCKGGLPNKDFFISYDDSEHSLRISKLGDIICVPTARIFHDTVNSQNSLSWKTYYSIRNKLYSYNKHFGKCQMIILAIYYYFKSIKDLKKRKMTLRAISDALRNRLGCHDIYKPGWEYRQGENYEKNTSVRS